MASSHLQSILQNTFGFPAFRANQQAVCEAAVAGRDVLLVMPTGAGKSLCYQLPALARGGTALVISPLIALMDDQAAKLTALGLRVGRIHSGLDRESSREVCRSFLDGTLQFLFIAPERLRVPGFAAMLSKRPLSLVAIDEAHCISQWGHDFRPDYRNLARHIAALRPAPVMALTATATPQVQRDIVTELALQQPAQFIHGFRRTNLAIEAAEIPKSLRSALTAKLLLDPANRPAICYAPSRKDAEALALELNEHFPTEVYHAGLLPAVRERTQRNFLSGLTEVVVATVAFGMGIDKNDVRTVIHTAMPASVEGYYQEIGRAGRDGKPSRAVLLYSYQDRRMHDFFLERDYPAASNLERIARLLRPEPIHADELRFALKLDMETFAPALDRLLSQGAADIDFNNNVVSTPRTAGTWRRDTDSQGNFRRSSIDAMMRFATAANCRMSGLVLHFGDTADSRRSCGLCDSCAPKGVLAQSTRPPGPSDEREMRRILRALGSTSGRSAGKLHTELYPKAQLDRKELDALLDALSRAGYVTLTTDTFTDTATDREISYRKAAITPEGREVEEGAALVDVLLRDLSATEDNNVRGRTSRVRQSRVSHPSEGKGSQREALARAEPDPPLTSGQKAQEAALRAWRKQTATDLKQPPYCVFADRTLREIIAASPRTTEELAEISGMGPVKVERWGTEICEVLRESTPAAAQLR